MLIRFQWFAQWQRESLRGPGAKVQFLRPPGSCATFTNLGPPNNLVQKLKKKRENVFTLPPPQPSGDPCQVTILTMYSLYSVFKKFSAFSVPSPPRPSQCARGEALPPGYFEMYRRCVTSPPPQMLLVNQQHSISMIPAILINKITVN